MGSWSPSRYLQFEDERTRAASELLARVRLTGASRVIDIGCGPGNSTELLAKRFPDSELVGIDSSAEMLAAARERLPRATFVKADITEWAPNEPVDLLFGNAIFQWVTDHMSVLFRLLGCLAPGGVLAIQVPDNLDEPAQRLMSEVAIDGTWRDKLKHAKETRDPIPPIATYYNRLRPVAAQIDIWHTIYNHPLDGPDAIAGFFGSTGLRPFLAPLDQDERASFLAEYRRRLGEAYPPLADGKVLLRFPRLFVVATRS